MVASELASNVVQECLGFTSLSSKLSALQSIQNSLQSCFADDGNNYLLLREEWQEFLEGTSTLNNDNDDDDDGFDNSTTTTVDFMLRDSLIKCLVESCHPNDDEETETTEQDDDSSDDDVLKVIESSLLCLSYLIRLRCVDDTSKDKKKKTKEQALPMFDGEFVSSIASDVVEALKYDGNVTHAACELLISLLRSDRPRNEICIPTIRDLILLPACGGDGGRTTTEVSVRSVACIAQVLSTSIIAAVEHTVPKSDTMDQEELSMRRETAALNRLQDMRDVIMNVGLVCSNCLSEDQGEDKDENEVCAQRILNAIQEIYDIAAFAVESQLETLLDDKAAVIISRLSHKENTNQVSSSPPAAMNESYDDSEDGKEDALEDACTLPPIYANIAKPPEILSTLKNLESMLSSIGESLATTDAELWDERLDALIDLERILAGGVVNMSPEARYMFIEKLRKMKFVDQFTDLRSQITQQVCRVLVATAFEYREYVMEEPQLNQTVSHFVECCVPQVLNLCKSGTRLMATQGMNCVMCLMAVCGEVGYPRLIPRFCDEILGKRVHKNRKRGSVIALTVALRVWDVPACFVKHVDQLMEATKEGATNRDPAVREEGRKLYWAMASNDETSQAVTSLFDGRSREMKGLKKEETAINADWEEGGVMFELVQTGVLGQALPEEPAAAKNMVNPKPRTAKGPPRNSVKRPASAATRLRVQHGTPFKSQRVSTPMKSASTASKNATPVTKSVAYSPMKFSETSSVNRTSQASSSKISRARLPSIATVPNKTEEVAEGKENTMTIDTPVKNVAFGVNNPASPMMGTPIVNLLARASPISAEKVKNTGDILGEIIAMLSDRLSPHEQSLGIKALALFAKENPSDSSWVDKFPLVLKCLLGKSIVVHFSCILVVILSYLTCLSSFIFSDHIKNMPTADFAGPVDFIRSPSKNLTACHQMQHLFLQGVRSLLQFVPGHVKDREAKEIICCMLEVRFIPACT